MVDVMLCESAKSIADIPKTHTIRELKIDGIRALFIKGKLVGRYGTDITDDFKEIKIDFNGILDGEIVIFADDNKLLTDFNALQNHKNNNRQAVYVAFDVLEYNSVNLTAKPLIERRRLLHQIANPNCKNFMTILDLKEVNWKEVKAKNLEGLIFKNPNSVYEFRRSKEWIKVKNFKEVTLPITSFEITEGEKGNSGFTILTEGEHRVGVANPKIREQIKELFLKKPLKAVVQYLERTKDNRMRMPTFKELVIG
jgi:ATP-dependent DNA ligase